MEKLAEANVCMHFVTQEEERQKLLESPHPYLLLHGTYYRMDGSSFEKCMPFQEFLESKGEMKSAMMKRIDRMFSWNMDAKKFYGMSIWYQLYIAACMLENGSETLTYEQERKANLLHDDVAEWGERKAIVTEAIAKVRSL